jgi:Domain of unknown function (DUF927)/Toprim domain
MSNADSARKIWSEATADTGLIDAYRAFRCIPIPTSAPQCVRLADRLRHPSQQYFPTIVIRATDARTGVPTGGIQRVFLNWKGKGKAEVDPKKLSLGPITGSVGRLADPIDGKPLLLGEGFETTETAMAAAGLPGWMTFGTSGLKAFNPPDEIKWIVLLAENDAANEKALEILIPTPTARGIRVDVAKPPPGLKDFNDLVNGTSGHTPEAGLALVKPAIEDAIAGGAPSTSSASSATADDKDAGKFSLTDTGLWRRKSNRKWTLVARWFEVFSVTRGPRDVLGQSDSWGRLLRFRDRDGVECEAFVSVKLLQSDPSAVIAELGDKGMDIVGTPVARRHFVEYLLSANSSSRATVANRTGWLDLDSERAFVLPGEIIGGGTGGERILFTGATKGFYAKRGSLDDWRESVGALAHKHRLLRFSIATALCGCLLRIGGYESGCTHLYGRSSEG